VYNSSRGEEYTAGTILLCFYGILWGFQSLGMTSPNLKAIEEARVAGKRAFDVIERVPAIRDAPTATAEVQQATIAFEDVQFQFCNRNDKALNGVSFKIEAGQKVGIVGPSGSGKSTIVQLIERFYEA